METQKGFRAIVSALVLLFLTTNVLMAYTPEKNFWVERRQSAARRGAGTLLANIPTVHPPPPAGAFAHFSEIEPLLPDKIKKSLPSWFLSAHADLIRSLPYAEGSVRKISLPLTSSPGGPLVIHIQDVHQNLEAQRHIAAAVAALAARVDVIGLEGSTRPLDLARFRAFPDRTAVSIAATESLAQNQITGPIHAALTSKGPFPPVVGIDDPLHYTANIEAYSQSAPQVAREKEKLKNLLAALETQKQRIFSPSLLAFDRFVSDYREGRTTLSAYVKLLKVTAPTMSPECRVFCEVLEREEQMDFQSVESDRVQAVEILAARLDEDALAQLTSQGMAYKAGTVRYGEFYAFLRDLCSRYDVPFGKDLDAYIRYVLLSDRVDAGILFEELQAMESAAYSHLAATTDEKKLIGRSRQAYLTGKLLDFALTPAEWMEYQNDPVAGLKTFESFYHEAHARDSSMGKILLTSLAQFKENTSASVGLIVAGGYHAPGLTRELTKVGVPVITFVPKITKVDALHGEVALDIFTREKTPLQKLFEGETLFLGQDPLPEIEENFTLPAKISLASTSIENVKAFTDLVGDSFRRIIADTKKSTNSFHLRLKNGRQINGSFDPRAPVGSKFSFRISPVVKESFIALSVAGLMGGFYFFVGNIYPPLFGHLSRPESLLFIFGSGILNGFTNWFLINRAQKASQLPTISLWPILALQVLIFGPLYGFVGNELLRLIPGVGFVPPYWIQALVGQFIVAPLVFDPLGYFLIRRFISKEPVKEILGSMKKNMLPYVILNALLWTPIGALGLSFPNNAATNIVASVGGILATLVSNLFVIRLKHGFLFLDAENIKNIRFPPFRWIAQGLDWLYSRAWLDRYLMILVVLGYSTLVGILVLEFIPLPFDALPLIKELNFPMDQPSTGGAVALAVSGLLGSIAMKSTVSGNMIIQGEKEAENTLRWIQAARVNEKALVIGNAWVNEGAVGVARADGVLSWVREMEEPLRSEEFRRAYVHSLIVRKSRLAPFSGPREILHRFHLSMFNLKFPVGPQNRDEGDPLFWTKKVRSMQGHRTNFLRNKKVRDPSSNSGSNWEFQVNPGTEAGFTVPLVIVSSEGKVEDLLNRLDQINRRIENPLHVVLAGTTEEEVKRTKDLKGVRPFVHVVESPVAPMGVVDPAALLAGVQAVPEFKERGAVSWWIALSPGVRVDPDSLTVLGDEGVAGSLKTALTALTQILNGSPLKPADLNTLLHIVTLVLRNA